MTTVNIWDRFLSFAIPKGIQRKMVLVAVFLELEHKRGEEHPRLEDLNAQMHLVDDVTILDRMADLIGVLTRTDALQLSISPEAGIMENCTNVISSLPAWLQYNDRNVIIQDLAELAVCSVRPPGA